MYGLTDNELEKLCNLFRKHEEIEQAVLYGSRAKGNFKPFSDIDITLMGDRLTYNTLSSLSDEIDDLLLPYSVWEYPYSAAHQTKLNFTHPPSPPSPFARIALFIGIQEVGESKFKK